MAARDQIISETDFLYYPLNIARSEVDTDNLRLYNQELNQKSDTLFVQESANCKVELWQVARPKGHQGKSLAGVRSLQIHD